MNYIDSFLNKITMYKLVLYGLIILVLLAEIFTLTGALSLSWYGILLTMVIAFAVAYGTDFGLAKLYNVPANSESGYITGMILACILPGTTSLGKGLAVALCAVIAIASKYIIAYHDKHLFNPAAFGASVAGLVGLIYATWWIGTPVMAPFVIIFGLMILRKLHRFSLFLSFFIASIAMTIIISVMHSTAIGFALRELLWSSPLLFLGFLMLTEPATMPPNNYYRVLFGIIVGLIFAAQLHIGNQSITPQIALIVGNLFAYFVSFRQKLTMKLISKQQIGTHSFDLVFEPNYAFSFAPGQYLDWTIPHKNTDWRGNRRTFSIASSPKQKYVHIGTNAYEKGSSFKTALTSLAVGSTVQAGGLAGDFILPPKSKKLVWIAGGIGITPFRSMAEYLVDTGQTRNIHLFYIANQADKVPYRADFDAATKAGIKTTYIDRPASKPGERSAAMGALGNLSADLLKLAVTDYAERYYFVSGSPDLVAKSKKMLTGIGVPRSHITTDYFSGY
jgi:ferredoxin-NADP reductase/Na+-translocating ferredoxin:NAD+ oxidoreductase RnfD subunit